MGGLHCEILWRISDDLGVLQKSWNKLICFCGGCMNIATYKVVLEENLLPSALTVPQLFFFPSTVQWSTPHSQVNLGVDAGPQEQSYFKFCARSIKKSPNTITPQSNITQTHTSKQENQ